VLSCGWCECILVIQMFCVLLKYGKTMSNTHTYISRTRIIHTHTHRTLTHISSSYTLHTHTTHTQHTPHTPHTSHTHTHTHTSQVMHGHHFVLMTGYGGTFVNGSTKWFVNDPGFDRFYYLSDEIVGYRLFNFTMPSYPSMSSKY